MLENLAWCGMVQSTVTKRVSSTDSTEYRAETYLRAGSGCCVQGARETSPEHQAAVHDARAAPEQRGPSQLHAAAIRAVRFDSHAGSSSVSPEPLATGALQRCEFKAAGVLKEIPRPQ